jgi:hypothetical protein
MRKLSRFNRPFCSNLAIAAMCVLVALPLAGEIPPGVPSQYQAIYSNMTSQIAAFQTTINQDWNGTPYAVAWAPHLSTAESDQYETLLGANYFNDTVLTELLELQATGARAVTVHIDFPILYQPFYTYTNNPSQYEQFVSFYQEVVNTVHANGMKLVVEATVSEALYGTEGSSFAPYYQTLNWTEYMSARAQNAVNVAQLIAPDYLSLICEPDSESVNGYQPTEDSPTGALQLLTTILTAFQQAGITNITLGAGAGTWISDFSNYIQEFSTTSLNYIDMHVYPVNNSDLTLIFSAVSIIQGSGKAIGVSEAWPNKEANSELGKLTANIIDARDVFSFWSPIDTAFLQAMVDCAQYEQFAFLSPSYPQYFAEYLNWTTDGTETPSQLLPAAFAAAAAANITGTFTSTGMAFSTMIVGPDTTPPAIPAVPTLSTVSSTGATITWTPTTDNVGVAAYYIYRDGALVSTLAVPPFQDSGLTPGLTYAYTLSAFDAQGNVSGQSAPLYVTTVNTTPPTVPTNLAVTGVTQNSVSLSWSPSSDPGGVGGYRVLKGSSPTNLQIIASAVLTTSYVDSHVTPSTTYYYAVEAYNSIGIASAPCAPVSATTLALPPPTNLEATSITSKSVSLSWTASGGTDPPVAYRILRGTSPTTLTILVAKNLGTTYTNTPVGSSTTYYYEVEMVDSIGLTSLPSNLLTVMTLP